MRTLWQDLRYGIRVLAKSPGVTVLAVVSLAVGVGGNTAIFSVVNAVLLHPVSYPDPDRVVFLWEQDLTKKSVMPASPPDFLDWRSQSRSFGQMAAVIFGQTNLTGAHEAERVLTNWVTASFFHVLGVQPALGRGFLADEERTGARSAVLSHRLWQRRFGGDPNLIGKTVTLDGESHTVVGVMPRGFDFLNVDLWRPLRWNPEFLNARGSHFLIAMARLKPGLSLAAAQTDMNVVARRLSLQYPETNTGSGVEVKPVADQLVSTVQRPLAILLGAVGLVLLIACANVANLLLARAAGRSKEVAIRAALGASRGRVVRQLLTESVLLSLLAGAGGLVLSMWAMDALANLIPANYLPNQQNISVDMPVLAFTLVVSLLTGILFGLAPTLAASRIDLTESLKEGTRSATYGAARGRVRDLLVVSEIALSLILLIGASLLVRSFLRLAKSDPGFRAERVLTMQLSLPEASYPGPEPEPAVYREILRRAQNLPGVASAGFVSSLPLEGHNEYDSFSIEGRPDPTTLWDFPIGDKRVVSAGYFQLMGIPLLRGRAFTEMDTASSLPVAAIDETAAKRYWPGEDPLGKRIAYFTIDGKRDRWLTIVGITGGVKQGRLEEEKGPSIYLPLWQNTGREMTLAVRSSVNPANLTAAIASEIRGVDRNLPVSKIRTMDDVISESVWRQRFAAQLLGMFAAVALVLAMVGAYGVMAYSVAQRTQEIGIRMALGACQSDTLRLVLRQALKLTMLGLAVGLAGAFALTRLLATLLYQVQPADPVTFAGSAAALAIVSLLAGYIPARQATHIDPIVALRYE